MARKTPSLVKNRKKKTPFAAYAALLFNASLCVAPFIGARAISTAYGEKNASGERHEIYEGSSEALTATRKAMETRFARLADSPDGAPRRDVWAKMIREELTTDRPDMATVQGLLKAAPSMLGGDDGRALRERIAVTDGGGEQALVEAALAYLPEDVQDNYEKHTASILERYATADGQSPSATQLAQAAPQAAPGVAAGTFTNQVGEPAAPGVSTVTAQATADDEDDTGLTLNAIGSLRDLSIQAKAWAAGDRKIDEFTFINQAIGLTLANKASREGASLVQMARRAQQLDPKFERYLQKKLFDAAPPQRVKRAITAEFQSEFGYVDKGEAIEKVMKASINEGALASLLDDLSVIRDIARETSPSSAILILSRVKDGSDLRRARLVAQAGGDRAVSLARYDGDNLLDTARTVITWNNALKLQLAGLGACFGLLLLIAFNVFWRSFTRNRPVRRSAVYAYDEPAGAISR